MLTWLLRTQAESDRTNNACRARKQKKPPKKSDSRGSASRYVTPARTRMVCVARAKTGGTPTTSEEGRVRARKRRGEAARATCKAERQNKERTSESSAASATATAPTERAEHAARNESEKQVPQLAKAIGVLSSHVPRNRSLLSVGARGVCAAHFSAVDGSWAPLSSLWCPVWPSLPICGANMRLQDCKRLYCRRGTTL